MVLILKLQTRRAGPELKCQLVQSPRGAWVLLWRSHQCCQSQGAYKPFTWSPSFMASAVGKSILKVVPSSPSKPLREQKNHVPLKSRLLISMPIITQLLSASSYPQLSNLFLKDPIRCQPPLFFLSSYPTMNQKELWFKVFSLFFFSSSKVMCPLGSSTWFHETVLKKYTKPTIEKILVFP